MTNPYQFGIKDYKPHFLNSSDELIKKKGLLLIDLVGSTIDNVYLLWSLEYNEDRLDAPIVVNIKDYQIELCVNKTDEFSITNNTFDINSQIDWYGDNRFEWKELKNIEKFKIVDIEIIELENEISNVSSNPKYEKKWWSLGGIQFIGEYSKLSIFNGFDCNSIHQGQLDIKGMRTIKIKKFR